MFRLQSLIHTGPTLMTAFQKLKGLSSLNIRNHYYYYYQLKIHKIDCNDKENARIKNQRQNELKSVYQIAFQTNSEILRWNH